MIRMGVWEREALFIKRVDHVSYASLVKLLMNSAKLFICVVKEIERRADVEQFVLREQRKSAAAPSVEFVCGGVA